MDFLRSSDVLPVAFSVVFTLSRPMLSFCGQLLEQLNVASLSRPIVFFLSLIHI